MNQPKMIPKRRPPFVPARVRPGLAFASVALLVGCAATSTPERREGSTPPAEATPAHADAHDVAAMRAHLAAHIDELFVSLDVDRDGKLTGVELQAATGPAQMLATRRHEIDTDGDGGLDRAEVVTAAEKHHGVGAGAVVR